MTALIRIAAALLLLPLAPAAAQQDIGAPGTVPHRAAGTGFPERVGEFRRVQVLRYSDEDISANYDLRRGEDFLRLSIYIYPAPSAERDRRAAACRSELDEVERSIGEHYPGGQRVESGEAPAAQGSEPGLRLRSVHRIQLALRGGKPEDVRSETRLFCYVDGDWLVKYRASSNSGFDVAEAIDTFVRLGPWPGRRPGEIALR